MLCFDPPGIVNWVALVYEGILEVRLYVPDTGTILDFECSAGINRLTRLSYRRIHLSFISMPESLTDNYFDSVRFKYQPSNIVKIC